MPRTKQAAAPATGGHTTNLLHTQHLTDHVGDRFVRVRYDVPERPIPEDFHRSPVFSFQVYSTLDLGLDEIEESAVKRARLASLTDRSNLFELVRYLNFSLDTSQKAMPIFDVYKSPQPDVLAMVEHQRKEIQHRKAQSDWSNMLQIPKLVHNMRDSRKYGFLIAIDSDGFKLASQNMPLDSRGPLWVTFDRRTHVASTVEIRRRLECDIAFAMRSNDVLEVYPEKLEVESKRNQQHPMSQELGLMYSKSYRMAFAEDGPASETPPMDYAQDEDETQTTESSRGASSPDQAPELDGFLLERHKSSVLVKSDDSESGPTLQYLIYVSYLAHNDIEALESTAKRFTLALTRYLPTSMTVDLDFRIPSQPILSSVLHTYRTSSNSHTEHEVGTLTTATSLPTVTVDAAYTDSTPLMLNRVHPISRYPAMLFNDPRTSSIEPYQTFLVVLDKPDFVERAGVLFLLADGGKQRNWPSWRPQNGPELDYIDLQVWRSAGMRETAERLAMIFRNEDE